MGFNTAILLITFNRPEVTKRVFASIADIKPSRLYIASDGAKESSSDEQRKITEVRDFLTHSVNWECQIKHLFRDQNMGCGPGVKDAIDWFFVHEKQGIILEDDTVPVKSFYPFCEDLLIRYEDDRRVGMISGNNHFGVAPSNYSYFFSRNKGCWGWATWRRAWENMDFEMSWLNGSFESAILANMGHSKSSSEYWRLNIEAILNDRVSTWDWQWYFSLARQNQLCIIPCCNLVSNIGFGNKATHTKGIPEESFLRTIEMEFPLSHSKEVLPFDKFDALFEKRKTSLGMIAIIKKWFRSLT